MGNKSCWVLFPTLFFLLLSKVPHLAADPVYRLSPLKHVIPSLPKNVPLLSFIESDGLFLKKKKAWCRRFNILLFQLTRASVMLGRTVHNLAPPPHTDHWFGHILPRDGRNKSTSIVARQHVWSSSTFWLKQHTYTDPKGGQWGLGQDSSPLLSLALGKRI